MGSREQARRSAVGMREAFPLSEDKGEEICANDKKVLSAYHVLTTFLSAFHVLDQ